MSARNKHSPNASVSPELNRTRAAIANILLEATAFVAADRVEETARSLLPRAMPSRSFDSEIPLVADALSMAMDLALFTASASGQTAFDRLARQRRGLDAETTAALDVIRRSVFRLVRIEAAAGAAHHVTLRDLATGEVLPLADENIGPSLAGLSIVGRLGALGDGRHVFLSAITPLDSAALAAALALVRPGVRAPLPSRAAETVYRHVLRHGTLEIPGLNRPLDEDDEFDEINELTRIAHRWAEPGERDPADVQHVRSECSLDNILDVIHAAVSTRMHGVPALAAAYAEILGVQLEVVQRRQAAGSGLLTLDRVRAALEAEIAQGMPPQARDVFNEARRRLGAASAESGGRDADLDRLIGRIQALRAKTVDQGCTEAEALAAAEKVAELLDRYGLSLSELDLKRQTCEGAAVETNRKRVGPVDECVPAIAAFFDCRVWGEKAADGTLRHVFFGLPADVMAARYLYDLVEAAFATETALFRAGPTYGAMPSGVRRTATTSFGLGFARGISAKLQTLRTARESTMRGATGRDLVVAKAEVVDDELERLGLRFRVRTSGRGRRVLSDAFEEGHEAGLGFEYTPGVGVGV